MIKRSLVYVCLPLVLLLYGCSFVVEEHITGPYYLVAVDTEEHLGVSYALNGGDYIGRVPAIVQEVGFNDSLLIAKTNSVKNGILYYLIDRRKDHAYAHEEEYILAIMSEAEYRMRRDLPSIELKKIASYE